MARGSWRICSKTQDCTSAEGQVQQAACFESLETHDDPTNQCGWDGVDGQPGCWGAAVVGASNSKPAMLMNRPLEAISTKRVPKKQIFRLPTAPPPPRTCRIHVALRRRNAGINCSDGDDDVINGRLSNNLLRAYHPIRSLCRHRHAGSIRLLSQIHSTHVLERHRKHHQIGNPSDVVLQLSAAVCPWKPTLFRFRPFSADAARRTAGCHQIRVSK